MSKRKLKLRIAEVTYPGRIDEYKVVSFTNIEARTLIEQYLGFSDGRKSIRVRDTSVLEDGEPRVLGRNQT